MAAHQAPPSLGFSRQEHWSGLPFPSPMHESEKWKVKVKLLSRVRLLATPWTATYQAPPSMGFSRQEYWSGLPLPSPFYTLWDLICVQGFFHSLILNRLDGTSQVTQWKRIDLPVQEMQEMWVWSLGWEDPLEEEMALQYSCLGNPMDTEAW